jgi:phage FluMu gp28-like protein
LAKFYVGVDLGQASDYTAIAVAERVEDLGAKETVKGGNEYQLHIRHLERFRDVRYPEVSERVKRLLLAPPLQKNSKLVVDATGVGAAVVDMLRGSAGGSAGLNFDAVVITGGDTQSMAGHGNYRVPKRDLVGGLQVLLQSGRLKIASSLEHAETLRAELLNFRVKINLATGHDSYEHWREGDHDDLVLAAALAVWSARAPGPTMVFV